MAESKLVQLNVYVLSMLSLGCILIKSCFCQSLHTFTSRCDFTLLGRNFFTPKVFCMRYIHTYIHTCIHTVQLNLNFTHACREHACKASKLACAHTVACNFGVCMRASKHTLHTRDAHNECALHEPHTLHCAV